MKENLIYFILIKLFILSGARNLCRSMNNMHLLRK